MASAKALKRGMFIVGARRTPFGAFGGSFTNLTATDLAVESSTRALEDSGLSPSDVSCTFVGNVVSSSLDAPYISRHVGLRCGIPQAAPALTVNRLCGSGFEVLIQGTNAMEVDPKMKAALCSGTENMSAAPLWADGAKARWGVGLGAGLKLEDSLWAGLTDSLAGTPR